MSERYWGEITIGGTITVEVWEKLKLAIYQDTGESLDPPFKEMGIIPRNLVFEQSELAYGEFTEIEEVCHKYGIPFKRQSLGQDPDLIVFTPANVECPTHVYPTTSEFEVMTEATELMELREALKEINLSNAPTFINDKRPMYESYAKHILSGKDLLGFMVDIMTNFLPSNIPELPKFEVKDV